MDSSKLDENPPSSAALPAEDQKLVKWRQKTEPLTERLSHLIEQLSLCRHRALIVAIGGPGGTGKTTLARLLSQRLPVAKVLHLDDYRYPRVKRKSSGLVGTNPRANNMTLIKEHLRSIKKGQSIKKPIYNAISGTTEEHETVNYSPIVILEGEVSTYREIRKEVDLSIFIDSHWRTLLNRRIERDIYERGYSPEKVISTFLQSNLRDYPRFGAPSKAWCQVRLWLDGNNKYQLVAVHEELMPLLEVVD